MSKEIDAKLNARAYRNSLSMMRLHITRLSTGPGDDEKRESLEAIKREAETALGTIPKAED